MSTFFRAACAAVLAISSLGCSESDRPQTTSGGTALLPIETDRGWGYIDGNGDVVVEPRFEHAWRFSNGVALVKSNGRYGFIEPDGTFAVEPRFRDAWHFSGGLAPVELDTSWAFVDRDGRVLADTQYNIPPSTLVEGQYDHPMLQLVSVDDRFGFATGEGQTVIDPIFENAWHFSGGLARVKSGGKWGYIDREGAFVVEPRFDVAWDFQDGVAMVQVDGATGYIDREGRYIWRPSE